MLWNHQPNHFHHESGGNCHCWQFYWQFSWQSNWQFSWQCQWTNFNCSNWRSTHDFQLNSIKSCSNIKCTYIHILHKITPKQFVTLFRNQNCVTSWIWLWKYWSQNKHQIFDVISKKYSWFHSTNSKCPSKYIIHRKANFGVTKKQNTPLISSTPNS